MTKKTRTPVEMRVGKDNRLEIDKGHYYSRRCRCMSCLQHWLAVTDGLVVVKSHDGKHNMVLPGSANGTRTPPK